MKMVDTGVVTTGEPGRGASLIQHSRAVPLLPSMGRYVLTFSPMHDKKAPVGQESGRWMPCFVVHFECDLV